MECIFFFFLWLFLLILSLPRVAWKSREIDQVQVLSQRYYVNANNFPGRLLADSLKKQTEDKIGS